MGLRLVLQPRPLCPAFYAISVRRLGTLPAASFRFRLTADTLAVRLTLPTTKRVVDFHHQAIAHGGRTTEKDLLCVSKGGRDNVCSFLLSVLLFCEPSDNVFQHHSRRVCQAIFSADERDEFLFRECYKSSVDHCIQFSGLTNALITSGAMHLLLRRYMNIR